MDKLIKDDIMIKKIKTKLGNKDTKTLISNFSYLTIIEASNYILPFISIPYIVRTVGVEKYGVIMFAYAVMIFFNVITNYGFQLLATKYISINRDDLSKISKYYWSVLSAQLILFLISLLVFILLIFSVEKFSAEKLLFLYAFGMVFGNIIFPIWFFQGLEKMKYISIFTVFNRVLYTILIFSLVNTMEDYILVPLFNSLSMISIGLFSLYFIHFKFKVNFVLVPFRDIKLLFIEGWHLFLSTVASSLYTSINTVLLGFLTNYSAVGIFSIAATLSGAIGKIVKIYSRVTYPYMAKYSNNKELLVKKARLLLRLYSLILLIVSILTFISASFIIPFIFGPNNEESIVILHILAIVILIEPLGGFFTPYLVIKNKSKLVSKITFYTMILNLIIILPLIYFYQARGMAITIIIVQSFQVYLNIIHNKELIFNTIQEQKI